MKFPSLGGACPGPMASMYYGWLENAGVFLVQSMAVPGQELAAPGPRRGCLTLVLCQAPNRCQSNKRISIFYNLEECIANIQLQEVFCLFLQNINKLKLIPLLQACKAADMFYVWQDKAGRHWPRHTSIAPVGSQYSVSNSRKAAAPMLQL